MSNIILWAFLIGLLSFGCVEQRTVPESKGKSAEQPTGSSALSTPTHGTNSQELMNNIKEVELTSFEYDFGANYDNISITCNDNNILININGFKEGYIVAILNQYNKLSSWKSGTLVHYENSNINQIQMLSSSMNSYNSVISPDDVNQNIIPNNSWLLGSRSFLTKACFVVDVNHQYRVIYIARDGKTHSTIIDLDRFRVNTQLEFADIPDFTPVLKNNDRRFKNFAYNGTKVLFTEEGYLLYNWPRDLLIAIDNNANSITYLCGSLQDIISSDYPGLAIHQMCVCYVGESIIVATEQNNIDSTEKLTKLHIYSIEYDYTNNNLHMYKYVGSINIQPKSYYPDYPCSFEANSNTMYFSSNERYVYLVSY